MAELPVRRFLTHVLPEGFHRIRHYGPFANGWRVENIARARQLLNLPAPQNETDQCDQWWGWGANLDEAVSHADGQVHEKRHVLSAPAR